MSISFNKPRRLVFILILSSLLLSHIHACGGDSGTVSGQQTGAVNTVSLNAKIFSSVPEGQGTTACSYSCELNVDAGANETPIVRKTFSTLSFLCLNGVPASGQGIDTTFTFDPNSAVVLEGLSGEVVCAESGASFIDDLTLNFYSASFTLVVQQCQAEGKCEIVVEMTSLKDQLTSSGLIALVSKFSCPALEFLFSLCGTNTQEDLLCSDSSRKTVAEFTGCDLEGEPVSTCGNRALDTREQCDPSVTGGNQPCAAADCVPPGQPLECICRNQCGNGLLEHGEQCESCPPGRNCDTIPVCIPGSTCKACQCQPSVCNCNTVTCSLGTHCDPTQGCQCLPDAAVCGNGTPEGGEECGEPNLPSCPEGSSCTDCHCISTSTCGNGIIDRGEQCDSGDGNDQACLDLGKICDTRGLTCQCVCPQVRCPLEGCAPESQCSNGCDDDADQRVDCDDSDCATDPACASACPNFGEMQIPNCDKVPNGICGNVGFGPCDTRTNCCTNPCGTSEAPIPACGEVDICASFGFGPCVDSCCTVARP